MSETLDVCEKLRPLEEGIGQQQIAMAMMHVFPLIIHGTIQPSTEHKMMDHDGESCLAIAVEVELGEFQLSCLRGEMKEPFWSGYSYLGFHLQDGLLYVGVPMNIVNIDDPRMVADAMQEFGDYDADFKWQQEQGAAEKIVAALINDFNSKSLQIDLPEGGDAVDN